MTIFKAKYWNARTLESVGYFEGAAADIKVFVQTAYETDVVELEEITPVRIEPTSIAEVPAAKHLLRSAELKLKKMLGQQVTLKL